MKNIRRSTIQFVIVAMLVCLSVFGMVACDFSSSDVMVTYQDGDEILKTDKITEGLNFVPEKEGYKFEGWYLDKELTNKVEGLPSTNCTLYAKWSVLVFKVTFYDNQSNVLPVNGVDTQQVEYGQSATAPDAPYIEGKEFLGWSANFDCVKSNLEIYPRYKDIAVSQTVKVQFVGLDGNTLVEKEFDKGANIFTIANTATEMIGEIVPNGFLFDTWCSDKTTQNAVVFDNDSTIEQDQVFYPRLKLAPIFVTNVTADKPVFKYTPESIVQLSAMFDQVPNVQYSMQWYAKVGDDMRPIENGNASTLALYGLEVGQYTYVFKLTAESENMTAQSASRECSVVVEKGTLVGIGSKPKTVVYNGKSQKVELTGIQDGDIVAYRIQGQTEYVENLDLVDVSDLYKVEYKVDRANYETYFSASPAQLTINKALLTVKPVASDKVYGEYMTELNYLIVSGLCGNDDESVVNGVAVYSYDEHANVGEHVIQITSGLSARNYDIEYEDGYYNVTKRDLTVTVNDAEIVYGDEKPQFTAEYVGFAKGENFDNSDIEGILTCDTDYVQGSNAQEYTINASGISSNNYNIIFKTGTLSVAKKQAKLVIDNKTITYGDDVEFTLTAQDMYGEDDVNIVEGIAYECEYKVGSNVGSYAIQLASGYKALNYEFEVAKGTLTVNKKDMTIGAIKPSDIKYGDNAPQFGFEQTGAIEKDIVSLQNDVKFDTNYVVGNPVNEYEVVVSIDSQKVDTYTQNYNITYVPNTFQVLPTTLTISADNKEVVYGDIAPEYTVQYSGWVADDSPINNDFVGELSVTSSYKQGDDEGEYIIDMKGITSENYIIEYNTAILTVNKKNMTINAIAPVGVVYGDIVGLSVDNNVVIEGVVDKDKQALMTDIQLSTDYTSASVVGKYNVNIAINNQWTNYNIVFNPATFVVAPKAITLSKSVSVVYNPNGWSISASELVQGKLLSPDTAQGTLRANSIQEGKTYIISGKELIEGFVWEGFMIEKNGIDVTNCYDMTYDISLTIIENSIAHNAQGYHGTYDGVGHSITVTDIEEGASVKYSVDGKTYTDQNPSFVDAGTYIVYYQITKDIRKVESMLEVDIEKANVVATVATPSAIKYGEVAPIFEVEVSGALGDDNQTIKADITTNTTYKVGSPVGSYDVVASIENAQKHANYNIEFKSAKLVVNKKALIATTNDVTVTYGSKFQGNGVTYNGFVEGDDAQSLSGTITYNTDYVTGSSVGETYTVTAGGQSSSNYEISYVSGKVNVTKKNVQVIADDCSVVYGETTDYTFSIIGLYGNDTKEVFSGVVLDSDYVAGNGVGQYVITISGGVALNYEPTFVEGTLNVTAKPIEINVDDKSVEFGSQFGEYTGQVVGLVGVDSLVIEYVCKYTVGSDVGEYDITAIVQPNNNYAVSVNKGKLSVTSKATQVVWELEEVYTYNNTDQSNSVKAYIVDINGEKLYLNVAFEGHSNIFKDAGNYTATATSPTDNYTAIDNTTSVIVQKANFSDIAHEPLTGTYAPSQTLEDIELGAYYKWQNPTLSPTCDTTSYKAVFNSDPSNYNDYVLDVTLVLDKAVATLQTNIFEFDYSATNTHTITPIAMYNGTPLNATLYTIDFKGDDSWNKAGTFKTSINIVADNYKLASDTEVFIKVKAVKIDNTYYTIEDAIKVAESGNVIIVTADTSFADESIRSAIYNDASYYTVKAGAELLVPYDADYRNAQDDVDNGKALGKSFVALTMPSGIVLEVNGILNVNAKRSTLDTPLQGHTGGNYGQITMLQGAKINVNNGATLNSNGYVIGEGEIEAKSGSNIYDVFALKDWKGGSNSSRIVMAGLLPFNRYTIQNIEVTIKVSYGATYSARYYLYVSSAQQKGAIKFVGAGGLFEITNADGYVIKDTIETTNKLQIDLYGNIKTNAVVIKAGGVSINSENLDFPILGNFAITLISGSTIDIANKFLFLPGSSLVVEEGATANIKKGGKMSFCGESCAFVPDDIGNAYLAPPYDGNEFINQNRIKVRPYTSPTDKVECIINGTVTTEVGWSTVVDSGGCFGGVISNTKNTGKLELKGKKSWDVAVSVAGIGLTVSKNNVTFKAKMKSSDGTITDLANGTYVADGNGGWVKQ